MRVAAEAHLLACPDCQRLKLRSTPKHGLLRSLTLPEWIWSDTATDFVGGLPELKGCDSVYVIVDKLSKHAHFVSCLSSGTEEGVVQ